MPLLFLHFFSPLQLCIVRVRVVVAWFQLVDDCRVIMKGYSTTSRWVYWIVGLIVMAELVTVSGRGHFDYQSSFGPKERRKRQGKCHSFSCVHTFSAGLFVVLKCNERLCLQFWVIDLSPSFEHTWSVETRGWEDWSLKISSIVVPTYEIQK